MQSNDDDLVIYCDNNRSPFKTYFEERCVGSYFCFFQSEELQLFLQAQIPGSGISDRQRFVATLKNYIQICANPEESKTILGTDEDELDDEEEIPASDSDDSFDTNFNLASIKCTSSTSASSITNSTVSSSTLTTSIVPSPVVNKKSIYSIADIENSAIVDRKFSAINLNFEEDKWEAFGKFYSPSQLQIQNYDLISSKSPFWNYLSTLCKFIFTKIENIFPYVIPNRHAWEVSVAFAQKYPRLEEMFKRYKDTHSKATKFVDVADVIQTKLKNLFQIRSRQMKSNGNWPYLKNSKKQVTGQVDENCSVGESVQQPAAIVETQSTESPTTEPLILSNQIPTVSIEKETETLKDIGNLNDNSTLVPKRKNPPEDVVEPPNSQRMAGTKLPQKKIKLNAKPQPTRLSTTVTTGNTSNQTVTRRYSRRTRGRHH